MNSDNPILLTGVGKRIGYALAMHLLFQGYTVIGTYRTRHPEIDELEAHGALLYSVDLYKHTDIDTLVRDLKKQFSALRAIIHNASDWLPDDADIPCTEVFQRMMQVHAGAPYQLNTALRPLLENHPAGADIIHLTDYVAERGSARHIAYAASKAALQNMTLSFAAQMAPRIQVNAIAPSLIAFNPEDDEAYRQKALNKSVMKIEPGFAEVVTAVDYLLDSQYMTGRTLQLDGGRHIR